MKQVYFALAIALWCGVWISDDTLASSNDVSKIDRAIHKEPKYESKPKYSLITLGDSGEVKVWMVEDGKRLFLDKNANGDLSDDGPPLLPRKVRDLGGNRWDFEYFCDAITPPDGSRHTNFVLARWNYNEKIDSYGLSLSVGEKMPMYAGWFGTFWSGSPDQAPVIHFGGPFTPRLLRRKDFLIGESHERLSFCFLNPGSGPGAESRLSIEALPALVVPQVTIQWPMGNGAGTRRSSFQLNQRCCYWEFYTTAFELPEGVVAGKAKVTLDFPAGAMPVELTTRELEVDVVGVGKTADSKR